MIVRVKYLNEALRGYMGAEYTYITSLELKPYDKVIAPTYDGDKKALVTQVNLPNECISPSWADRVKEIVKYDRPDDGSDSE